MALRRRHSGTLTPLTSKEEPVRAKVTSTRAADCCPNRNESAHQAAQPAAAPRRSFRSSDKEYRLRRPEVRDSRSRSRPARTKSCNSTYWLAAPSSSFSQERRRSTSPSRNSSARLGQTVRREASLTSSRIFQSSKRERRTLDRSSPRKRGTPAPKSRVGPPSMRASTRC